MSMRQLTLLLLGLVLAAAAAATDLDTALQAAQAADPTLASATASRDAAAENIAIARARLLPQVTLQNTSQHVNQTTHSALGFVSNFDGQSRNTQLTIRQGLWRQRDWLGLEAGKLQAAQGEAKLISAQADLWQRVSEAWLDAVAAQAQYQVQAQLVDLMARAASQEARRLALGDGTRDSAAEAAAQLAQTRAQAREAELDSATKLAQLRRLTRLDALDLRQQRLPDPDVIMPRLSLELAPELDTEAAVLDYILSHNPELDAARAVEQLAERRLRQAQADHWPTVDAIASATQAQSDSTNVLGTRYQNKQLGVQVVVPLYAGGGISASQRQAAAAWVAASADREALAQRISTQFSSDWSNVTALRARLVGARELVQAGAEARKAAELGIKGGTRTWGDVAAAAAQQARRQSDVLNLSAALLKTQARLLSLLPVAEPAWANWSAALSRLSLPSQPVPGTTPQQVRPLAAR
jgi:outer membrane protein TolC